MTNGLYTIVIACLLTLCGCNSGSDRSDRSHTSKPYLQLWEGRCVRISGLLMNAQQQPARQNQPNNTPGTQAPPAVPATTVQLKLYLAPTGKCTDTTYFHNSDVLMGFGRTKEQRDLAAADFSFHLASKIWTIVGDQKIRPTLCHLEQNFGIDNGRTIWLQFSFTDTQMSQLHSQKSLSLFFDNPLVDEGVARLSWPRTIFNSMILSQGKNS
jgi:hypothetical protein